MATYLRQPLSYAKAMTRSSAPRIEVGHAVGVAECLKTGLPGKCHHLHEAESQSRLRCFCIAIGNLTPEYLESWICDNWTEDHDVH